MAAIPPSSSPRLPSPPPMAEDQIGPTSPGMSLFEDPSNLSPYASDPNASRRIRPGTKAADIASGPPLTELHAIDSPFPLTEHLSSLHHHHTHPTPQTTTALPPPAALSLATPPPSTSREIHLYELARLLIHHTNAILTALFADHPPCSSQTCPEMRASEWQYLCAVHDPPKSCCAIDYCCHTLDWAAGVLCNSKLFPSRLGLGMGSGGGGEKVLQQQMKELTNIFRRVYRIFAHAWFQHREVFWRVEGRTGLYGFFKTVCDVYGLVQVENYTIPDEAMGQGSAGEEGEGEGFVGRGSVEPVGERVLVGGETTKRHRGEGRPGSGYLGASTIAEEEEEEGGLERAATVFRKEREGDEEEGFPGVERSETVKPESAQVDGAGGEEGESTEITVVEAEVPEDAGEEVEADTSVATEAGEAVVEVDGQALEAEEEEPAAEGGQAGKSVED